MTPLRHFATVIREGETMSRHRHCHSTRPPQHLGPPLRWFLMTVTAAALMAGPMFVVRTPAAAQADQPNVAILSPKDGDVITTNTVGVVTEIKNWKLRCDLAGLRNVAGTG